MIPESDVPGGLMSKEIPADVLAIARSSIASEALRQGAPWSVADRIRDGALDDWRVPTAVAAIMADRASRLPRQDDEIRKAALEEAAPPPDSVTEREIRDRAWKVIKDCGWKNGNSIGLHSAVELMVRLGMELARDPVEDRCNYPDCGCDFDAVCEVGLRALSQKGDEARNNERNHNEPT